MRATPRQVLDALYGSRVGDRVQVDVWRDDELLVRDLPVLSGSLNTDVGRAVRTMGTLTVADHEGTLAPWGPEDALGPGGSVVVLNYIHGLTGATVPFGEHLITHTEVPEAWEERRIILPNGSFKKEKYYKFARELTVNFASITQRLADRPFMAPCPVQIPSSAVNEIKVMLDGWASVIVGAGVKDRALPAGYSHPDDPLAALEKMCQALNCVHRITSGGDVELLPATPVTAPIWRINSGDGGVLINTSRSYERSDYINAVAVIGKDSNGAAVTGSSVVSSGPMAYTGPHGIVSKLIQSDLIDTDQQAADIAASFLSSSLHAGTMRVPVTALPHPGLQEHDVVTLAYPNGELHCPVLTTEFSWGAGGMNPMNLSILAHQNDFRALRDALRRSGA